MAPRLDGPRIEAASGQTKQLVVILHGFGADGRDLISLGQQWAQVLPDAAFVAPSAGEPCEHVPEGRQWFRLTDRNPHERWSGACSAAPLLNAYIDEELARYSLPGSKVALVGFSQGAMMALHVGLRRPKAPAGILSYSGLLVGPEKLADDLKARPAGEPVPPIFLVHGTADEVVPPEALFGSAQAICEAGASCQWRLSPGLGHNIDGPGLAHGALFLASCFGLPYPKALMPA
ncbi:MAG: phospholipase [Beijerinckiaceae bacterium]|nr:phospholipase [Beijerinckiaceae bacterium]